ncbi:MAG: AAA family ATPase [Candidatus Sumerlaeota bacterium]|nr:AAA family ATPase [Candidatus Sumerlaeota bacterium]
MNEAMTTNVISTAQVRSSLKLCYDAGRLPVILWGAPGVAKSALIRRFAEQDLKLPLVDIRLPQYDPVDLKGIPGIENITVSENGSSRSMKVTKFFPTDLLPVTPAVIVFEELANALPATQVVCQRILLERSLDTGWAAHDRTMIMAASNRRNDRCGANMLLQSMDNRLVHFEVAPDVQDWLEWVAEAKQQDGPMRKAATLVCAFVNFRPELAHKFNADMALQDVHGFPSFRSWERVIDLLTTCMRSGKDFCADETLSACIRGCIGVAAGSEFDAYLKLQRQLPMVKHIVEGNSWELPPADQLDVRWALVACLANFTCREHYGAIWEAVEKLEKGGAADLAVVLVKLAKQVDAHFTTTRQFDEWALKQFEKGVVG